MCRALFIQELQLKVLYKKEIACTKCVLYIDLHLHFSSFSYFIIYTSI